MRRERGKRHTAGRQHRDASAADATETSATGSDSGFFEAYAAFSRTLRTWLVGYGIGVPVLLASQERIANALKTAPDKKVILAAFLGGVAVQVAAAFVYKTVMWYSYVGELDPAFLETRRYAVSDWISNQYWLELLFDVAAAAAFVWATWRILAIVSA